MGRHDAGGYPHGLLGSLLGIETKPLAPLPPAETDLADGDIVELVDGVPRRVAVLARLEGGQRVCVVDDGVEEHLVVLNGTGHYWLLSPCEEATGDLVAEAYRSGRTVAVYLDGQVLTVCERGSCWRADLSQDGYFGATWFGSTLSGGDLAIDRL
jgi:hypothetical protein